MRIRARKFPGIINATQIDWFFGWPEDALIDVGRRFISDIELPTPELYDALAQKMAAVHVSIDKANKKFLAKERRYIYTTPKSFLELISFYKKLLAEKRLQIETQIIRLDNGLEALAETKAQVETLRAELVKLKWLMSRNRTRQRVF
jgi:dynein heavy chain